MRIASLQPCVERLHQSRARQGDIGDYFYIIKSGEAVVYDSSGGERQKVNHLFKADYFGEQALLRSEPR